MAPGELPEDAQVIGKRTRTTTIASLLAIMVATLVITACTNDTENQASPDFDLKIYDIESGAHNQLMSFSDLRGQVVILNFWATWCAPCRAEMPVLEETYAELRKNGTNATILGVDMGVAPNPPDTETVRFLSEVNVSYPVGHPGKRNIGAEFGITSLPATLLIDPAGKVVQKWIGPITSTELVQAVNNLQ